MLRNGLHVTNHILGGSASKSIVFLRLANSPKLPSYSTLTLAQRQHRQCPVIISEKVTIHQQPRRNYIFFPSSLDEASKAIRESLSSSSNDNRQRQVQKAQQLMIRLRNSKQQIISKLSRIVSASQNNHLNATFSNNPNNSILMNRYRNYKLKRKLKFSSFVLTSKTKFHKSKIKFHAWKHAKQQHIQNIYISKRSILKYKSQHLWSTLWNKDERKNIFTNLSQSLQLTKANPSDLLYSRHTITITEPFRKEWFTKDGYPLTSQSSNSEGRFVNPWSAEKTNGWKRLRDVIRWKGNRLLQKLYPIKDFEPLPLLGEKNADESSSSLPQYKVNRNNNCTTNTTKSLSSTSNPPIPCENKLKLTWIGHSTTYLQVSNQFTILTDPIFSQKASPIQSFPNTEFLGVPRHVPPSVSLQDLWNWTNVADLTTSSLDDCNPSPTGRRGIDVCLISHDHYDHLDFNSISELAEMNIVKFWVVPLGLKEWFTDNIHNINHENVIELEWWEGVKFVKHSKTITKEGANIAGPQNELQMVGYTKVFDAVGKFHKERKYHDFRYNFNDNTTVKTLDDGIEIQHFFDECDLPTTMKDEMVVTCAPSQHWCSRTPFDRNKRLWCSWAVNSTLLTTDSTSTPSSYHSTTTNSNKHGTTDNPTTQERLKTKLNFYFAGDTGYPQTFPLHRQIGDQLGPFDLAAIPIGAYKPRFFMKDSHCDPYEALKIHQDIRSKRSVGIHWGTFPLADEADLEPPMLLDDAIRKEETILKNDSILSKDEIKSSLEFVSISHGESVESSGGEDVKVIEKLEWDAIAV